MSEAPIDQSRNGIVVFSSHVLVRPAITAFVVGISARKRPSIGSLEPLAEGH